MANLPPIPDKSKVVSDKDIITQQWFKFIQSLYNKIAELEAQINQEPAP
jgi:hypothetical protein